MKKTSFLFAIGLTLLVSFIGCKNREKVQQPVAQATAEKQADNDSLVISYQRTPCFGQCATFEVKVYKSGYATFNGQHFIKPEGMNYQYVDMEYLMALAKDAKDAGFFTFQEKYAADIPDLPSTITYLHLGKEKLKVTNHHGQVPEALSTLEKKLDRYFKEVQWIALPNKTN